MEYGGKENLDHRAFWYCQCPPKALEEGEKSPIEQHLASLPESGLRVLLSLADILSAAPLSLAELHPGAAHRDIVWSPPAAFPARPGCPGAVPVCGAAVPSAVPSAASAAAPGCPEHRTQINVLPVSLGEAWRQHRGNLAGKNTWKIQHTEN